MKIIYNPVFLKHDTGNHPENAERLKAFGNLMDREIKHGKKYLSLVHSKDYIQKVKEHSEKEIFLDADTFVSRGSFHAAVHAVGASVMASQRGDFALVRPPGHHAYEDRASGFCLFNNIAIAVERLVRKGRKVFILDIDGHLGDGTMYHFYNSDKVLFCSLHQYPAFPGFGFVDEIGEESGKGYTINIPLPPESGDDLYMKAIEKIMPIALSFQPDIVAVSAGFDAHQYDPLLNLRLTVNTYYKVGQFLAQNFEHIFAVLEGGYNLEWLPKCVENFIAGMNNKKAPFTERSTKSDNVVISEFRKRMIKLTANLQKYWDI